MSQSATKDIDHDIISRRALTYKFLSECFREPAEHDLGVFQEIDPKQLMIVHAEKLVEMLLEDTETLRMDYTKLFLGPFEVLAVPHGSVYLDNKERLMTESAVNVAHRFELEGLKLGIDGPPDHITAELEFMYYLIVQEGNARRAEDLDLASLYRNKQRSFLEDHLGCWIGEFTGAIEQHAENEFYRKLGEQTRRFVLKDRKRLEENQ